jgi:hypothetical protein
MRHNPQVGQASDQASDSVGQAGARQSATTYPKPRHEAFSANELFGSVVITSTDHGSDHVRDRARKAEAELHVEHRPAESQRQRQIPSLETAPRKRCRVEVSPVTRSTWRQ